MESRFVISRGWRGKWARIDKGYGEGLGGRGGGGGENVLELYSLYSGDDCISPQPHSKPMNSAFSKDTFYRDWVIAQWKKNHLVDVCFENSFPEIEYTNNICLLLTKCQEQIKVQFLANQRVWGVCLQSPGWGTTNRNVSDPKAAALQSLYPAWMKASSELGRWRLFH